ncbi:aminotransferase class III-fold pyridoxal phosphate-dependent enzyme, partial [Corallococcus exiguus]|uniref:aminotransferase class III-fold pyridoxal phosphate-dependent enzyme n=1 Tax=Corallococcus exiguus TaxID=83462 RepID=UPI0014744B9F
MKNQQIGERNARYIPGGYSSQARRLKDPIAFVSAKGARVTDAEGRTFTDHNSAFGAIILGHCHEEHMRSVAELSHGIDQIGLGMTTLEGDLAELVCTHVPSAERVNFCCSGTEAT